MHTLTKTLAVFTALLMLGCASTPTTQFYTLEAVSQPPPASSETPKKHRIGIGPITLPPVLDRKQIVTKTTQNTVEIAEFHQWAAPLKDNVIGVLAQNMTALQPHDLIRPYPWSAYGAVDYRVLVDITRFETAGDHAAHLEASWALMDESHHNIINNGRVNITRPLGDASYTATAQALSAVLGQFCVELSRALPSI
jgi:uncharacterized lipoprotein YmbA